MLILKILEILFIAYLVGSIPNGLIVVKIFSGKDVREVESGRIGGTNAMRAAGLGAGLLTAALDILKGVASGWIVAWLMPGNVWLQVFAAIFAILGHNYSIFLAEIKEKRLVMRGGAGGATCLGGALALYPYIWVFVIPLGALVFFLVGYASVTTMSVAFIAIVVFAYRAWIGASSWVYVLYGVLAELILLYALRPNLVRLREGNERLHGLRSYIQKRNLEKKSAPCKKQPEKKRRLTQKKSPAHF
jgi:acyl phosphate:glycerol-3-phosphate acyltransferase